MCRSKRFKTRPATYIRDTTNLTRLERYWVLTSEKSMGTILVRERSPRDNISSRLFASYDSISFLPRKVCHIHIISQVRQYPYQNWSYNLWKLHECFSRSRRILFILFLCRYRCKIMVRETKRLRRRLREFLVYLKIGGSAIRERAWLGSRQGKKQTKGTNKAKETEVEIDRNRAHVGVICIGSSRKWTG